MGYSVLMSPLVTEVLGVLRLAPSFGKKGGGDRHHRAITAPRPVYHWYRWYHWYRRCSITGITGITGVFVFSAVAVGVMCLRVLFEGFVINTVESVLCYIFCNLAKIWAFLELDIVTSHFPLLLTLRYFCFKTLIIAFFTWETFLRSRYYDVL